MAKYRVWNRHPQGLTHKEKFRDEMVEIPAGKYTLMDYEDAVLFRGQYFPMKKRPDGGEDPAGWKVLQLERHDDSAPEPQKFICHLDGKIFPSQALLDAYLKENYSDRTFTDESLEEEIAEEKKRGRPRKDKSA